MIVYDPLFCDAEQGIFFTLTQAIWTSIMRGVLWFFQEIVYAD